MKTLPILAFAALGLALSSCGVPNREERNSEPQYDMSAMSVSVPPQEANSEAYNPIVENGYHAAQQSPYSTFAIDVDAASYSNMRRMLSEGTLPPPDAVRIEEWINYFSYRYPQPQGNDPFSISTEYAPCPWNMAHGLLRVSLQGKTVEKQDAPPNNLVFLIDVSGSMQDADKLPLLKKAFALLLPQLRSEDKVSIVTYAGNAGVVLESADGDEHEKILKALDNLYAGGSTAGGEGILKAYELAEDNFKKKGNNRVILATDGDFNVGVSDRAGLEKLIAEKRDKGIYLSVLGFGTGNIKDNTMELLADKGNGNYNYIDNMLEARKVLVSQFGGTLQTIAKDVKIQVEFNPRVVKEYRLIGYENRSLNAEDFNDDKKDAGELGAGHCVTALYEIVPAGSKESNVNVDALKYQESASTTAGSELANIKFRYKQPGRNDTTSLLLQQAVANHLLSEKEVSPNYLLAAAVSEFGLLMRNSPYKGSASFGQATAIASQARSLDAEGYVSELIRLMKLAKDLGAGTDTNKPKED